jgi:hypothetical protein
MMQRLLLGDGRLDLRAPAADGDPKCVGGNNGDASGLAQADEGEREEEEGCRGEEKGWLPAESEEVADREACARSEQRNPAKLEGLDDRRTVQPGCSSTESRHEKR